MTVEVTVETGALPVERVNVLRRADEPAHFLWRGRLYAVRSVRAHWFERPGPGEPVPVEPVGPAHPSGVAAPVGWSGGPDAAAGHERELWRVEAAAGRMAQTGVFDLCLAWPDGEWTLASVTEQGV